MAPRGPGASGPPAARRAARSPVELVHGVRRPPPPRQATLALRLVTWVMANHACMHAAGR
eukprot:5505299-Prymnesium_polylepis.3